jgi:hypothetical protein
MIERGKEMENQTIKFAKVGTLFIIGILIASSTTVLAYPQQQILLYSTKKVTMPLSSSHDVIELKYYNEENLSGIIGMQGTSPPYIWKSAIRLTQEEMAVYMDCTLKEVNVAFSADYGCPSIDVRIYIYDKGTSTSPGIIIANDTTFTLNTSGDTRFL